MYKILKLITLATFFSCNNSTSQTAMKIDKSNIKSIFNKPNNIVFIWTTWCGVSKSILKETYSVLQKDTNDYNIIIICGNSDFDNIRSAFESIPLKLNKYIISNASNYFPYSDRKNIKNFIQEQFENVELANLDGNYGIPITMLVDSTLKIINFNMPQDTTNIRAIINQYK